MRGLHATNWSSRTTALGASRPLVARGGQAHPRSWLLWPPGRSWHSSASAPAGRAVRNPRMARLEAVLLVAREALPARRLAHLASLADGTEARTLIRLLNERFDATPTAFRVEEVAGGYRLLTRPQFGVWLRRLNQLPATARLSTPALETLAVVAYRQPCVRAQVEAIRGVQCGEMLRQLMDRDLVRIAGRAAELGRPFLYATTRHFLETFGLKSLEELPRGAQLRTSSTAASGARRLVTATSDSSDS
ncbi:MAG: SMC-Scp complex subunit ScpB [Pirellulales bacterium]